MTGMDQLLLTRQSGFKASSVTVLLVDEASKIAGYLGDGMFNVEIGARDRLEAIDFRPLMGQWVVVFNRTEDSARHRKACRLIAQAKPSKLQMPIRSGDGWTVHTLKDGKTTTKTVTGDDAVTLTGMLHD